MKRSRAYSGRHQLVQRLTAQVGDEALAKNLLKKNGLMDEHGNLTAKGRHRDAMTASERAIDRAAKHSGKPKSAFKYNPNTNRATLKR